MTRYGIVLWVCSLIAVQVPSVEWASGASHQRPQYGRAVSISVLQKMARKCQPTNSCPETVMHLAGLTNIRGYVIDANSRDLILFGDADTTGTKPKLYLSDFVIALRHMALRYALVRGRTAMQAAPGCSIDPEPGVLHKLQQLGNRIAREPEYRKYGLEQWKRICRLPQQVRVLGGIPRNSHFSAIAVLADYELKRLVDGAISLPLAGWKSLPALLLDKAQEDVSQGQPIMLSLSSMNRFWLAAGQHLYREDNGIVLIEQAPVVLRTEEEILNTRGDITGRGQPDPLAKAWADQFTALFERIAIEMPVYQQLANLYRWVALTRIIQSKEHVTQARIKLSYFLDHYTVPRTRVHQKLPGRANITEGTIALENQTILLMLPSCGGVDMEIRPEQQYFVKDRNGRLSATRTIILQTRPSQAELFWTYTQE